MSAVVSEADLPGSGAVWLQTGRYSDMTDWRQFGRLTDFSERNMKDVITVRSLNDGIAEDVEGFGYAYGLCPASATRTGSSDYTRHRARLPSPPLYSVFLRVVKCLCILVLLILNLSPPTPPREHLCGA